MPKYMTSFALILLVTSCAMLPPQNKEEKTASALGYNHNVTNPDNLHVGSDHQIVGTSRLTADSDGDISKAYFLYGAKHLNLENYYFDIPVVYNDQVKKWLNYFQIKGRGYFERYSARAGRYAPLMGKILEEMGLPRDLIFLAMAESGFQNKAKSWASAVGPWQFMPFTGKGYGLKIDWYVDERRDPIKATVSAAKYLSKLYSDFGSWELAAAAYNAGEGKVGRAISKYKTENFWDLSRGRYLKSETKNYVPKIMALAILGKNLKSFGFDGIDFNEPLDFEEIEVASNTDLYKVAEAIGTDFEELHRLNPELMRWFTPLNTESYALRIPVGLKEKWESCCKELDLSAENFQIYEVGKTGANLKDIAQKHKVAAYVLEDLNGMPQGQRLEKGQRVLLPFRVDHTKREDMYADLYERPRKSILSRRNYKGRIKVAMQKGRKISNPSQYYTVQRGDTLWDVARKSGVPLDTIIASNIELIRERMIRAGDKLVIR
jgi:membrane-bound lytic murein transglycosylase D